MLNLVLFGPPGAGKGTQAEFLVETFKLVHLSTGDLLRSQIAKKTELGLQAEVIIGRGELVPDEVVVGMIKSKIQEEKGCNGFIFDGFPRTVKQARELDVLLQEQNTAVSGMLALVVEKQELINRLLERGKTSGRADDQDVSIIENRINVYNQKTAPLIDFYEAQKKYYPVEGVGSIPEIAARLKAVVCQF
ncbi:MAG TPA: adenylate kinase [Prolixibacteraceae bacterium]|nr:adenylate kinase [Prolixibacteraceae bacterium]